MIKNVLTSEWFIKHKDENNEKKNKSGSKILLLLKNQYIFMTWIQSLDVDLHTQLQHKQTNKLHKYYIFLRKKYKCYVHVHSKLIS